MPFFSLPLATRTFVLSVTLAVVACSGGGAGEGTTGVGVTPKAESTAAAAPSAGATGVASPSTPATTASPSPAPGIALTPRSGAVADLAVARRSEAEGDLDSAADAYIAVAARNTPDRSEAVLGAARVLLELERPADVRVLLEPFVTTASGRDLAARYMLARAYGALGLWNQAIEQYDLYIQTGRPAVPYAYLDRGRVLLELNQPGAAAASTQNGLALGVSGASRRTFLLAIAQANERAGALGEAIRGYNLLFDGSDSAADKALALARIAAIKRQQGDSTYTVELKRLLTDYPATSQAMQDLNEALGRGEPIDATTRGLVYYRNNDYTKADPAFREQITAAPNSDVSAQAYYYLGAILESRGDNAGAVLNYTRVGAVNPASGIADDALWWRARILEDDNKLDDARALYTRIVNEYPASSWAPDATFRRGMLSYRGGRYGEAAAVWAESAAVASAAERQRLTLWQAKSLQKGGNDAAAKPLLDQLAAANEDDYYGVRAVGLLRNKNDQPKSARESKLELSPTLDWAAAESWLSQRTGRAITDSGWSSDSRWLRAQELWLVGRSSQGDAEVFDLIEANSRDAIAMYTLSRMLQAQGRAGMSGRAGQRVLRVVDTNPSAGLPKELLSLSYPPAFSASAQKYAQNERISPLLLLAFIRQESFFDPRAESPAGALGLTQVLPSTGKTIAEKTGAGTITNEQLLHADLNLRLGANYMAEQLRSFGNEIYTAFAAYNAGPNAARRWRSAAGQDADAFLETVEYRETRLYVQLVAENYAIYRYLYGGEPVPNLPD